MCVCFNTVFSFPAKHTEEDACTATTPCSSLTGSWDNAWPKGIRQRTLSPAPKEVQPLRCREGVKLQFGWWRMGVLELPNKYIHPIKRNNY